MNAASLFTFAAIQLKTILSYMRVIILTLMLALNQAMAYSQTDALSPETIKQLAIEQKRMFAIFSAGDSEGFLKITGDDYLSINADGTYMNKMEAVVLVPKFKGSTNEIIEQTDRIHGNVVISTGRAKFYLGSVPVADIYFNQTWIYRDNRWQFIFWQGTMTGAPASYPIYFTLIGTLLLLAISWLVIRRFRRKKTMLKTA
jgi:hypothetical protein